MSNALEAASLVMVPGGYSNGVLGSVKPVDGTGDFTFTRGSNLSATRVAPNGYIEKGYENLLLQSNSFDSVSWSGLSKTSGILGYDGTNDAWEITKPAQPYTPISQSVSATGVWTFSLYAKANTLDKISIRNQTDGEKADIDLLNGLITYTSSGIVHSDIELISNDWYRLQITFSGSTAQIAIYIAWNNSTAGSVYIQDAMLNQGLVAYPYIETTTAPVAGGILEDEPRIDFSDGCGHLLLEPSRTNALPDSEYIQDGSGMTNLYNASISPEGVQNATKAQVDNGTFTTRIFRNVGGAGGQVVSVFAKAGEKNAISISGYTGTQYLYAAYNLTNGTLMSTDADGTGIEDYGNGWYRVWVYVANSTNRYAQISVGNSTNLTANGSFYNVTGNGSDGLYLYGWQAEPDATYPTSYIPTYGSSQTRLRDSAAELSNDIISGATEFTWLFDNTGTELDGQVNVVFQLVCTGTPLRYYSSQGGRFYAGGYFGEADAIGKLCVKYDGTTITMFKDGIKSTSTSSTNLGTTIYLDELFTSNNFGTPIKLNQMLFFKTALSDSECIALTTI